MHVYMYQQYLGQEHKNIKQGIDRPTCIYRVLEMQASWNIA